MGELWNGGMGEKVEEVSLEALVSLGIEEAGDWEKRREGKTLIMR